MLTPERRSLLERRIRFITAFTITWNVFEALVALIAAQRASSVALLGFGLDSLIEVLSAAAVAWQFSAEQPQTREKVTLRLVAFSFFALSIYVLATSLLTLAGYGEPDESLIGIILTAVSVVLMPVVSTAERLTGQALGSRTAVADSQQTMICAYLSAAVLIGLLVHWLLGWWWADPLAGLVIAGLAWKEGLNAWRGRLCNCAAPTTGASLGDEERCSNMCCSSECHS